MSTRQPRQATPYPHQVPHDLPTHIKAALEQLLALRQEEGHHDAVAARAAALQPFFTNDEAAKLPPHEPLSTGSGVSTPSYTPVSPREDSSKAVTDGSSQTFTEPSSEDTLVNHDTAMVLHAHGQPAPSPLLLSHDEVWIQTLIEHYDHADLYLALETKPRRRSVRTHARWHGWVTNVHGESKRVTIRDEHLHLVPRDSWLWYWLSHTPTGKPRRLRHENMRFIYQRAATLGSEALIDIFEHF